MDLLLLTKHSLYIVEVKKRRSIGNQVINEVKEKLRQLPLDRERSVRTALVYDGQLDARVEEEGYFDFVIPFSRLLGEQPA